MSEKGGLKCGVGDWVKLSKVWRLVAGLNCLASNPGLKCGVRGRVKLSCFKSWSELWR